MPPSSPPSPSAAGGITTAPADPLAIDANRRLLNRYRFVAQETMRLLAGWLPRVATFELKCEFGRMIWEASLQVEAYYRRLREIQSPAFQDPPDPAFITAIRELSHAPSEMALLLSLRDLIGPQLIKALESHEQATFPNSDFPSVYAIRHALVDLRAQLTRLDALATTAASAGRIDHDAHEWCRYIETLLGGCGGIDGLAPRPLADPITPPPCRTEFTLPTEAARDERFVHRGGASAPRINEEDYANHTTEEFERYATEMLAAETLAVILRVSSALPWDFQRDTARHLYDEVRHCLMGFEWMRRHGRDPFKSPQFLDIFAWRSQFPPVFQYTLLTMGNEVHAFPYRLRRVEAHQQAADSLSEQFVRYDIADETQHVRFGHQWLPELLRQSGETRSVADYTAAVLEVWRSEYLTGKYPINVE